MTEFREGDLVRAIPQLRIMYERSAVAYGCTDPTNSWYSRIGLVVEIEPQLPCSPTVVTVSYPGSLVRRSAALFERVQDD